MMNEFSFDLQRFDETTLTGDMTMFVTIAGTAKTINGGTDSPIRVSLLGDASAASAAVVTISNPTNDFFINSSINNSVDTFRYELNTGSEIIFTLGGGSAISIGAIDEGDSFTINNEKKFSKTAEGFFSGSADSSTYDKIILGSSPSTLALTGSSINSEDLESNWYKIIAATDGNLVLDSTDDFDSSGYKGIIAADTGAQTSFYAQLSKRTLPDRGYRISSITSASALSKISFTADVLSGGVVLSEDFIGSTGVLAPTIVANGATFHVDSSNGYILLATGKDSSGNGLPVSLNENAHEISLASGSLRAVGSGQTISTSQYTLSAQDGDGIIIYGNDSGNATLDDIEIGESFYLYDKASSIGTTYTMTKIGLVNADGDLLVKSGTINRLSTNKVAASVIANAVPYAAIDPTAGVIVSSSSSSLTHSLIAYGTDACATLSGRSNSYTLKTDDSSAPYLNLGSWQGISLRPGATISVDNKFIGTGTSPLEFQIDGNIFGLTEISSSLDADAVTLTNSTVDSNDIIDFSNSIVSGLTFTKGSLKLYRGQNVTLTGSDNFVINNTSKLGSSEVSLTSDGSSTTIEGAKGNTSLKAGRGTFNGVATLTVDSAGNVSTDLESNVNSATYRMNKVTIDSTAYSVSSNAYGKVSVNLTYGKSGGTSITGFDTADTITVSAGGADTLYTMVGKKLKASLSSGETKVWMQDNGYSDVNSNTVIDLEGSEFRDFIFSDRASLSISGSPGISAMNLDEPRIIIGGENKNEADPEKSYGSLEKTSEGYKLAKGTTDKETLTNIFITDSLSTVEFDENFSNTDIKIIYGKGTNATKANFLSLGEDSFTITPASSIEPVHISGATKISLNSGSLRTNEDTQTISAASYSISSYGNDDTDDGITVEISLDSNSNPMAIIRDIEKGESFYVNNRIYTRDDIGLTSVSISSGGESSYLVYAGGYLDSLTESEPGALAINVANLSKMSRLIAAESIEGVGNVLEIGTKNSVNAVVADKVTGASTRQANLEVVGDAYSLVSIEGATSFSWPSLDIISLTGGVTSINASVAAGKTIIAAGSNAEFQVTRAKSGSRNTFSLRGNSRTPSIDGADKIALFNGTIAATSAQSIAIDDTNKTFVLGSSNDGNIIIAYDKDTSKATIKGELSNREGDSFTLGGETYSIKGGNGMDVVVDSSSVTLTGLYASEGDVFSYGGETYSLRAVGLVRKEGSKSTVASLWNYNDSHSIGGGSVAVSVLTDDDNWNTIEVIRDYIASIPSSEDASLDNITFVDSDSADGGFLKTYGSINRKNGVYSLTKTPDEGMITGVSIQSGVRHVSLSSDFSNVSITSPNASVKVNSLASGAEDYSVTIYSGINNNGVMGLTSVTSASLIGGSLRADENIEVVASGRKIKAVESNGIIVSSSDRGVSIGGLDINETFTIDEENSYTLSAIGLINDESKLLKAFTLKSAGSNEVIPLTTIRNASNWREYIAPDENNVLTIKNNDSRIPDEGVLVVDNQSSPTARLATIDKIDTNTFSMALDVESAWPATDIIKIDNAGVSLTSDFHNRTIEGANSGATFTVTDSNTKSFFVKDNEYYTSITGAQAVNLTAGTIETNNSTQTITAGGKQISYSNTNKGDGIRIAVGSTSAGSVSASIAALNLNDVFIVESKTYSMVSDKKLKTGDATSGYELWRGTISDSVVPVSELEEDENWLTIIEATNGALTLSSASVLSGDQSALVIDTDVDKVYGILTKTTSGYSLSKDDSIDNRLASINLDENFNKLNLTSGFKNVSINAGSTTFRARTVDSLNNNNTFTVYYSGDDVSVENALALTLDKGTVKTSLSNQTISADGYDIHRFDTDSTITIVKNNNVVVGELEDGETFGVGNDSYTYFDNGVGVIRTKESSTVKSIADTGWDDAGNYTVGSSFDKDVIAVSNSELDLSNQKNSAVVVDDLTDPTKRLADLTNSGNSFSITSGFAESITSIHFGGNKDISLATNFNTTIKTDEGNHTFTINNDAYRAASGALTIKSGTSDNNEESRLINGAVALVSTLPSSLVTTETRNTIAANAGDGITVTAAVASVVTITALNKGDIFTVDETAYSVTGAGLFTGNKIWTSDSYKSAIVIDNASANGLNNESNWDYILAVSDSVLAIPPSDYPSSVTSWAVLSEDRERNYGRLTKSATGYSIVAGENTWGDDTISINGESVAFSEGFTRKNIAGVTSKAAFKITDNNIAFNVNDGADGATITGATKIYQSDGTIVLSDDTQTITTSDNHTVSFDSGNGINVIVGGGSASIGALSIRDNQDSFVVDGITYKMVSNGSIQRTDNRTFWTHSTLKDNSSLGIADLQTDSYWGGYITITDGMLKITKNTLGEYNSAFVIDAADETNTETDMHIYGTLGKVDDTTYSLDESTKTEATLSSIEVTTGVPNVSLTSGYIDIPITAGNTQFQVTATKSSLDGSYIVHYTDDSLSVDNATALTLIKGNWTLNDTKQTIKADGQTIQIGSGEVSISYSGSTSDGVNITGLDTAGEVITLNTEQYTFNAGDGINISIKGTNATVNAITNDDSFTIAENTFVKKAAGFVKRNGNSYLWTGSSDVTKGVAVSDLNDNDNNWTAVATVANDNIVINSKSNDAVLIDSIDDLSKIYGEISIANNVYGLSDNNSNDAEPSSITVEDVVAGISSAFSKIPISAAGANFAVNSLTSGNQFTVDATDNNAVLGNVSDVSLTSGTLADLTSATVVKTSTATVTAQNNSTVNVGFDGSEITIGELEHGESFTLNRNTYAYRNVGVVKDSKTLYVNDSLNGSLTSASLTGADFQTMFASDGKTLDLQARVNGVFVDSADNNVSKVYATQTYADKNYTFAQITDSDYIINAASLASGGSVTAAFDAQVITPETGTFTINQETYKAVSALTVDTTKDSSTLNKGTVSLSEGEFVDMTNVKDNVSVTGGNIQVTANDGSYTLGELSKNDTFTIGGYSYWMRSNVFIVRTGSDGTEEVYSASVVGGALEQRIIDESDYWNAYVHLDSNSDLNLNSSIKGGTVISSNFSEMYANLSVKDNTFTLAQIEGADTSGIRAINLAAEDSTLTTDFAATVKTTSGTNTFTVNENPYTAKDSALEIQTTANSSTITKGIIEINNSTVTTTSNHTITGSVAEVDVAALKFTPTSGQTFTLDGTSYKMTDLGLTKNDTSISRSNAESYVLPDGTDWSNMMRLSESGTLNLQNGAAEGSTVILDNGATKRMAMMTYGDNTYEITSIDGNRANTIQLGDSTGTLKLTADFDSDVTTGNGTYEINGSTYKGDTLTIKTRGDDTSSALYSGVVNLYADDSVTDYTNGNSVKVTADDGGLSVEAVNGTITTLSNLTRGDTFTINNKRYKVLGGETLVQVDAEGNPSKLYEDLISGSSLRYSDIIDEDKYVTFIRLEEGGVLNLSTKYGEDGWSAIVLADDSNGEPTERIARVNYTDANGYTLETTSSGDLSKLSSIKLGSAVKTFSTALDKIVTTTATGTPYNINTKNFTAQGELTIAVANNNEAILTNGSVTLNEDDEITTRRLDNNIQTDENIKATSGTITVTVDSSENTVTVAGLNTGEKFDVDGTEYTMTRVGLLNGDLINANVATTASVRTDDLSGDNWKTILPITDGELTLTAETVSNVLVVDLDKEAKYGVLTKSGDTYTLTQDDTDSALSKITMNGTKAIFGTKTQDVEITANGATFTAKTNETFTVNAAPADISPIIRDATSIYLNDGTIQAPANVPVIANGNEVSATSGNMTVTNTSGTVTVEGLDSGETFTANDADYKVAISGKLFDMTDPDNPLEVTSGFENKTFTLNNPSPSFMRIIAVDNNNLDLKNQNSDALVYDNLTEPTLRIATLTVGDGRAKTLTGENGAESEIQTVEIDVNDNLTVLFETKVKSPIGSVTVNTKTYTGATELVLDSKGTDGTNATLYEGTVTLSQINPSATDSRDNTVERDSGSFNATATAGRFISLDSLDNEESFIYGGKTYSQSAQGLIDKTDDVICTAIRAGSTVTLADLTSNTTTWNNFCAPVDGVLDISNLSDTTLVFDEETSPTTHLATLTVDLDGNKTLNDNENHAATEINAVAIAANDNLTIDFVTKINSPIGTVTVNDKSYAGTTALVIDSATDTSTLYSGTITLDYTNPSATDSRNNTLSRNGGSFNATAENGRFTTLTDLNPTESFTYNGVTYTQSARGLMNGSKVRADLAGTTLDLSRLSGSWENILAPVNGVLDISNFNDNARVYDNATNPTTQLATLTVGEGGKKTLTNYRNNAASGISAVAIAANDNLDVNFVTQVNSPVGTVTVNDKSYTGTTELVIDSDGSTSTLGEGTVSFTTKDETVTATSGSTITYTKEDGDGMTVTSTAEGVVTIDGLTLGDTFQVGDTNYSVSPVGPIDDSNGKLWNGNDYRDGITIDALNIATNWDPMLAMRREVLTVNADTLNDGEEFILVDNINDPSKLYGALGKVDGKYNLGKAYAANAEFTSLNVSGVTLEIASDYAGVDIVATTSNSDTSSFSNITLNEDLDEDVTSFTLDASGTTPSLSEGVKSLTLNSGSIAAAVNQTVTTGDKVITPTAVNGTMIIDAEKISGITTGDAFTIGDKAYKMLRTGLFNDTDNTLVTEGITQGTVTFDSIIETQLIAVNAAGVLDLSKAVEENYRVVDTVESPTRIYGKLNKAENVYTLDKQGKNNGINFIAMPDADSTLSTDISAEVDTPVGSHTFTINDKKYTADNSTLAIESDGSTSTLTEGKISFASKNDGVTTTNGNKITYTVNGDGMTVEVEEDGTITFDGLTLNDTFTIGDNSYKVSAIGPIDDSNGKLWNGNDYTEGITLTAINTETNWTPMLDAPGKILSIDSATMADGEELIIVDNINDPTKIYSDVTRADGKYTLTKPANANDDLTSIEISRITAEIAPEYAGIDIFVNRSESNRSEFSNIALNNNYRTFTLNASGDNPTLSDNVKSLTLDRGTVVAAVNQAVTVGDKTITPTAINGTMIIGTDSISGIVEGDSFTLGDKVYKMLNTGLFNDTDNKLVTGDDIKDGTLNYNSFEETQLIEINSAGNLALADAETGKSFVVDNVENPTVIYGELNKNKNTYRLDREGDADGIKSVTMPNANSTLTTDIAAEIDTPSSSRTFTVNKKKYKADSSALTINSDGSTSTLTDGKISFSNRNDTVTTTGGNEITYVTDGDGMTVEVTSSGAVEAITFDGLTLGDTFTVGENSYKVSAIGPINSNSELWNGNAYTEGITLAAINTADNWTSMIGAPNGALSLKADTMTDGGELIVVDTPNNPAKIYGDLTRADGKYNLTKPTNATDDLTSIDVSGIAIEIAPDYSGVTLGANSSHFSDVTLNNEFNSFTLDASGDTPTLSDNVKSLTLNNGTITAAISQTVTVGDKIITPTAINGTMIISPDNISGIVEGDSFTLSDKVEGEDVTPDSKVYKMIGIGLFNDADNKLVTYGMEGGTWTYNSFEETQLIAVLDGTLTLANATSGNSIVVDNVENPTAIYGRLNKDGNIYTLDKEGDADGIKSVTMPNADSTLSTDIAATVNTPVSSKTFTVNRQEYKAKNSRLIINSDGSTSTLTEGTVSFTDRDDSVTTTSGSTVTYTKENGDGMSLQARSTGSVILEGLTEGDTFNVGEDSYKVTTLGFHNSKTLDLWTSSSDYRRGVTISDSGTDGINNPNNWTKTVVAEDRNFVVKADTLENGASVIVIDSAENSTQQLGTLSKADNVYTLINDSDEKPVTITVINTKLTVDSKLAAIPVTVNGATFTVTVNDDFTVDATGDYATISEEATHIEISKGTINATNSQTVTATDDSGDTKVIAQGNGTFNIGGEEFLIAGNVNDINFGMTDGVPNAVSGFEQGATATIDGTIYTSPKDDSTLKFSEIDGWYFDGYIPADNKYNITVDGYGNVSVDIGVKFTDVVASGRTLPADGKIRLAADVNNVSVNVTNNGSTRIGINDKDNNPLAENLGRVSNVTFDSAGVMVERTSDVAGAVFTLNVGRNFETETATVTSNAASCEVGVGNDGTSLSVDKSATIDAPANTELTLGNANYKVNSVDFSTSGTAQASITADGVKIDLVLSDAITYDETKFNGTESATADFDKDGGITLTSGASVTGAAGKALNIAGNIILDSNTVDAATSTDVTAKANGLTVGDDDLIVTGDDAYKIDIVEGKITGLENIGDSNGVTVGGLSNGTIKTDKIGSFTVADRTFLAIGDASVTYGIEDGKITYVNDVDSILSGDFSDGLKVNGGNIQVTGEHVSLRADTEADREIIGIRNEATLTTAEGVTKVEPIGAGKFTFGDHTFETSDPTIIFNLLNSSVTGIDSLQSGDLIISQDENNLGINNATVTLSEVDSPITLSIADSNINSIYGLNGGIKGIDNATVYGLAEATVNDKFFDIDGDEVNAIISSGEVTNILGLDKGASVNSAPSVDLRTTGNGDFTFKNNTYNINDTLDGVVVFTTDINSNVKNIGEFEGSIYGDLDDVNLNDKLFYSSSDKVTVSHDGENIIELSGLSSGDSIGGSLSLATYLMPEGTLTVNDRTYILRGDDNGVSISGDGMFVLGLDLDASLTVAKGGSYSVNNESFNAKDGDTFIAARDHVYIYDPNNKPITERTLRDDIIRTLIGEPDPSTVSLSGDSAAEAIANGELDSPMAMTLDNSSGSSAQNIDFSESRYTKRVTLLGGDQDVKFNDEGKNAAYVAENANGKKNIELGDGGDVAVNDSPYAKVSVKTGNGADTIVNRRGGTTTVDVQNNGDTTIVPTSGKVTLQNYDNNNNAMIRSFGYTDLIGAIKSNEIKFGDGVMTLGDAVVTFNPDAEEKGSTFANLVDYAGEQRRVGFTHTDGGVINASTSADDLILKGNYAESSSDTTKTGASTLIGGKGDDTILAGESDYINGGAGDNQIYITDKSLRGTDGATIVLGNKGRNTIHNFNNDYDVGDEIIVNDISSLKFNYDTEDGEGLVLRSGGAQITFDGLTPAEYLVSFDDSETDTPYEMRISDGKNQYNVAVAQEDRNIGVDEFSEANVFFGDKDGGSGLDFSEYSGPVEVNLNLNAGRLNGEDAKLFNINKLHAGDGNSTLIGKAGDNNTLTAGTGYTSMWSGAGRDLMVGDTSEEKDGSTMFYYMTNDGRDTITGFGYLVGENDQNADIISLPGGNIVTEVFMQGDDIIMQINASKNDYLRLQEAVGKDFELNDRIAKVETQGNFDNLADFYVVAAKNATMKVGADIGNAQVWLDDGVTGEHGIIYKGEIKYLDASTANGSNTLVGNDLDNVIYGGEGSNSIWGGYGASRDTLVGGKGHNIFFFGLENGTDIITSINSGDVVYLANGLEQIAATTITSGGTKIELVDGSSVEIQGNANDVEYMLQDGSKYTADHSTGQWNKK